MPRGCLGIAESDFRYRPGEELGQTTPVVRPAKLEAQPWLTEPLKRNPRFIEARYWSDGMVRVFGREQHPDKRGSRRFSPNC